MAGATGSALTADDVELLRRALRALGREYRSAAKADGWRDSELAMALSELTLLSNRLKAD